MDLIQATTKELADELAKRTGVTEIVCPDPDHHYEVHVTDAEGKPKEKGICGCQNSGPARTLVVTD